MLSAEVLDNAVPATGSQYTVGAQFTGMTKSRESVITATCMAHSGFRFAPASPADVAANDFDNSQFPDLAVITRDGKFSPDTAGRAGPPPISAEQQRGYGSALNRCAVTAYQPFAALDNAIARLESPWMNTVGKIESSAPVRGQLGGFRSCMEQAGVPRGDVSPPSSAEAFSGFLAWETGLETYARTEAGAQAIQRHWAAIFVRCAKPTVAVLQRLQSAQRSGFLREHAQQIPSLQRLARTVLAETAK